ncbi:hypothetical protein FXO37_29447 [Capsicum annuum]|nr:hypothetical protein FXO37_29447 [Capsicum annuum]
MPSSKRRISSKCTLTERKEICSSDLSIRSEEGECSKQRGADDIRKGVLEEDHKGDKVTSQSGKQQETREEIPKNWSGLFTQNRAVSNGIALSFIPPVVVNGKLTVK